ncbi:MAG: hypothetical protein ACXVBJ_02250 [Flavisolibacter sp.]
MKRFNFLLVAVALVLTITAVSCTTVAGTEDGYYDPGARVYGNRVYVEDPYRGTIVMQQDPRTGRYYEVTPYYDNNYYGGGGFYSRGYRSYGNYGNAYPSRRSNSGYYNGGNTTNNNQNNRRSSEDDKKDRDDARNKVLGNH